MGANASVHKNKRREYDADTHTADEEATPKATERTDAVYGQSHREKSLEGWTVSDVAEHSKPELSGLLSTDFQRTH